MSRSIRRTVKYNEISAAVARAYWGHRSRSVESFVFVATTGRTGTLTLSKMFARDPSCVALHEPYPIMHGDVLESAAKGAMDFPRFKYWTVKSINVRRDAAGARVYVEANHLFIKTFCDEAARDFGNRMKVVHLVRPAIEVANSIYALGDEPGTETGNRWWLNFQGAGNLVQIGDALTGSTFSHPFFRALWYWYEVEARVSSFRRRHPSTTIIDFATHDLGDPDRVAGLCATLGVRASGDVQSAGKKREHTRINEKARSPLPLEEATAKHAAFRELLVERGFGALVDDVARES